MRNNALKNLKSVLLSITVLLLLIGCTAKSNAPEPNSPVLPAMTSVVKKLVDAAVEQIFYTRDYDPSYVSIDYPGGDVPRKTGVCSDVVVRAFRKVNIDLQKEIHEDMLENFSLYPKKWGLTGPDPNIDHRRVANQMTYFEHQGKELAINNRKNDYLPGDVVAWDLKDGLLHIGLVSYTVSETTGNYKIVHNIGSGAKLEDVLFSWKIIGHYRYFQ